MKGITGRCLFALAIGGILAGGSRTGADAQMPRAQRDTSASGSPAIIRMTMDELHAQGGVPRGWTFSLPPGSAAAGRRAFIALECFACHTVQGEDFPRNSKTARDAGPDLTGMGAHHPPAYFAESIVNPNRVVILGPGYTGADGLSRMPSYADTMTVRELIDVVAYLASLSGGVGAPAGHHMGHPPQKEGTTKTK